MKPKLTVKGKGLEDITAAMRALASSEVLVGFPEETTDREETGPAPVTNAALGYIHDNGQPEQNIPARPFMRPGIASVQDKLGASLGSVARRALIGGPQAVEAGLHGVGLRAKLAIQNKINEGIPPPLAESTLRARARRGRKGAKEELEARRQGLPPGMALAKPLVDTAQMRNAVNYVIRQKSKRKE